MSDRGELEKIFHEARDAEYAEVLGRCRDFHAELDKERDAGNLTFAELEENEEDLAKLEAWVGKIRARDRFGAPLFAEVERDSWRAGRTCRRSRPASMRLPTTARPVYRERPVCWRGRVPSWIVGEVVVER